MNVFLFLIFSIPSVQKAAANFAIGKIQPRINTEASIQSVRIKFFNRVELGGVYVEDQAGDTLLYAKSLTVRANMLDLLHKQLDIQSVDLDDFVINIYRETRTSPFNFQFLIDAFKSDKPKPTTPKTPFGLYFRDVKLNGGTLRYNILSEPETPGKFNPDHLDVRNLKLRASAPSIDVKKLMADIRTLSFWEHSGITVDDLQGMVRSEGTKLWSDRLTLTLNESELKVSNAEYNTSTKEFALNAKSEIIKPKDAAIFSDRLTHLNKPFAFEADLTGKLPYVEIRNLDAQYGSGTRVKIRGRISDYGHYSDADVDINIGEVRATSDDLETLIRIGSPSFVLPEQLVALQNISMNLKARGKLSSFNYDGAIRTPQGNIKLSGVGSADKDFKNYSFRGPISTDNLQLANILGPTIGVDDATLNANVHLEQQRGSDIKITADGQIPSILYKGYRYNNLNFDGVYSGKSVVANVSTDTEQNKLDLFVDLNMGAEKNIAVKGTIDRIFLTPFFTRKNWQNPYLTARINGQLSGSTIDDMAGTLVIDSTSLFDDNFIYNPGPIYFQALKADSVGEKKIQVMSSFLEGEITGDYHFATIGNELMTALHQHLPSLVKLPKQKKQRQLLHNNFNFNLLLKNTEDISYAFSLPFYNVEPATFKGTVDMTSDVPINFNAYVPRLMLGKNDIRETRVDLKTSTASGIGIGVNTYLAQDNGYIHARLNTSGTQDSVANNLSFDIRNNVAYSNGQLKVSAAFLRQPDDELTANILVHPTDFMFNQNPINIRRSEIVYTKEHITVDNFGMLQNGMLLLGIDGIASKNENERVRLYFNDTELATILTALNVQNVNGLMNGEIVINRALQDPIVQTNDFRIDRVQLYNDTIGTLRMNGDWNAAKAGLNINAFLENKGDRQLDISGFLPTGDVNPMDVNVMLSRMPLAWVQPFAKSAFSKLSGTVNSQLKITGKLSEPITEGWLGVDKGIMQVAYTNVTYSISDTIQVNRDNIGFDDLVVRDDNGHTARINLSLSHTNFGDLTYRVNMRLNDFMLLNNEERTDLVAYGNLKLSGDINLTGSPNGIYGDMNLRNSSKSKVMIELPQTATATEYKGVIYVNTQQEPDSLAFLRKNPEALKAQDTKISPTGIPILIRGELALNPQLDIGVLINPTTGDAIEISGNGDLNLTYNSKVEPNIRIFGDYVAEDGKVRYNLQSLKAVDFILRKGSTLTFVGDPLNTQFNITAYNQVRADLVSLSESFKNVPSSRVPVNALLDIQGSLEKMNLRYDIELPESSDAIKQRVLNFISTEEARIRQFAYLVTTGNFFPAEGSPDIGFNNDMFTTFAASALTKGLDALFSSALNDNWTISTNMETQGGSFDNVRMGLDVSTRLLDDRLRISTNLSYGDPSAFANQQAFVGEFDLDYIVNNWLTLRAYNHANERLYRRAPFTQGVGVVVTKESKKLVDLFKFSFRKKEEESND